MVNILLCFPVILNFIKNLFARNSISAEKEHRLCYKLANAKILNGFNLYHDIRWTINRYAVSRQGKY